jgi:hypothetical protein
MKELYDMIFKRRSVRHYDPALYLTDSQLDAVLGQTQNLAALDSGIETAFEIVKREETSAKFGEYCLLFYSDKKPNYLANAGYMLEQMDLFMEKNNIGVCWYGLAKPKEEKRGGLHYVIMLAFGGSKPEIFRTEITQFNRKEFAEIWQGDFDAEVSQAVRLAPSACNTQPWFIVSAHHMLTVYRNTKVRSFIPAAFLSYFNTIDIGICLCMLEIALMKTGAAYERQMVPDAEIKDGLIEIAQYTLQ